MIKRVLRALSHLFSLLLFFLLNISSCDCNAKVTDPRYTDPLGFTVDTANINISSYCKKNVFILKDTIDLQGKTLYLPADLTIKVRKGLFRNGIIAGNNTTLQSKCGSVVFDLVHIIGSWNVPVIKSSLFNDLSYDNSLKDIFALTNPDIHNKVVIEKGDFQVTSTKPSDAILLVPSNTDVILDGDIVLTPNGYKMYSIIWTEGDNISVKGAGSLTGDKYTHKNKEGDWGMGIYIMGGNKVEISGLTIKDCWGDCIYITNNANNIVIDKCNLRDGRRQGISITSARSVLVKNSIISKVRGTDPGYAIDIEPNKGDTVTVVTVNNVKIFDCYGGILSRGKAENSFIKKINVKNCSIKKIKWCPLNFRFTNAVNVINCEVQAPYKRAGVACNTVKEVKLERLTIDGQLVRNKGKNERVSVAESKLVIID